MNPEHNSQKKIIQISEEAFRPLHVPLIVGNECFVITQQDVRRIEDSRLLIYNKLLPNGDLRPMAGVPWDILADIIRLRSSLDPNLQCQDKHLATLLTALANGNAWSNLQTQSVPMDVETVKPAVATVQQQLNWNKSRNISPVRNVSNCGLGNSRKKTTCFQDDFEEDNENSVGQSSIGIQTCKTHCCCRHCTGRGPSKSHYSIGTNTPIMQDTSSQTIDHDEYSIA